MNKIKKIIGKYMNNEISQKRKIENLIFFLVILVIIVIGINIIFKEENIELVESIDTNIKSENIQNNKNNIEEKLEKILEKVEGVSNVSVLITYESDKQITPIFNLEEQEITTNEIDTSGGTRNITEKQYNKEIVFEQTGNNSNVIIEKELQPKIAGVIVVANFNNNVSVRQDIIKAVSVIADISEYKVQVLSSK